MNYLALLVGTYLALSSNVTRETDSGDITQLWSRFKAEHNKVYEDSEVEWMRRVIFERNLARINQHNHKIAHLKAYQGLDGPAFSIGLNHLADLSDVEYKAMNGFKLPSDYQETNKLRNSPEAEQFIQKILDDDSIEVPDAVDWRTVPGRVSRVKNQGQCGSCWAFASTGVLEGQERDRLKGTNATGLVELSEQNLVDCVKDDYGCNGGLMSDALEFVKEEGGIDDERSYPYEAKTKKCRYQKNKSVMSDAGAAILPEGDEQKLKQMVAKFGPVSVAIDASSFWFMFYRKGVFHHRFCGKKFNQLDHAVLVVGYGTDPKHGDYWIVKNSWGPNWGEKGYIRMARNNKNMCGIATVPTIPTFA